MEAELPVVQVGVNHQPVEVSDVQQDGSLDVVRVWYTIQGEGPLSGTPAVFVRLAGCVLNCPKCDTDYTSNRQRLTVTELLGTIKACATQFGSYNRKSTLVVLTGGEPFRQNISPLACRLTYDDISVQVETNGVTCPVEVLNGFPWYADGVSVVCSPKAQHVCEQLRPHVTSLKYVLDAEHVDSLDGLPTQVLGRPYKPSRPWAGFRGTVFVQPADEGNAVSNAANLRAAVLSCVRFGYRLSTQLHKAIGVD